MEKALGGNSPWSASLADIQVIDVARRGALPRRRLFVRTSDGGEARFLVPDVEDIAERLRAARQSG